MKPRGISLYECSHAKVMMDHIKCEKGHVLASSEGVYIRRLERGEPLILKVCQKCSDFDCNGQPIPPEERGWVSGISRKVR